MFDWNWLWVAGELGVSLGFYLWCRSDEKYLAILQVAPDIDINDLKHYTSSKAFVDYAVVHGIIRTNDSKPNSVLKSQFLPDCLGVIQRLTIREKKLEKAGQVWNETSKIINEVTRHVPFRLASHSGNYIHIDRPLTFSSITDQLEVVHVQLQSNASSSLNKIVDVFLGDVSTGVETTEKMLSIDTTLTGLGRLEKGYNGIWHLVPHEKWGGILTRSSRAEIISQYKSNSSVVRVISICFAVAAAGTAAYLFYKHYSRRQRTNRLPNTLSPPNNFSSSTPRLQCVICLENEIVYILKPCSHLGLCHQCAQTLQAKNHSEELCPLCRAPIEEYQRIFIT